MLRPFLSTWSLLIGMALQSCLLFFVVYQRNLSVETVLYSLYSLSRLHPTLLFISMSISKPSTEHVLIQEYC